jgi:hypothetical protein
MALAGSGVEDGLCFLFEIFEIFEIFAPNVQLVWRGRGKTKKNNNKKKQKKNTIALLVRRYRSAL